MYEKNWEKFQKLNEASGLTEITEKNFSQLPKNYYSLSIILRSNFIIILYYYYYSFILSYYLKLFNEEEVVIVNY